MARWLNVMLGVWLAASGYLLSRPGEPPRVADLAAGLALVAIALLAKPGTPAGFAAIVLGTWVMLAPIFLSYPGEASAANAVATGFAIVAVTLHPNARVPAFLRPRGA